MRNGRRGRGSGVVGLAQLRESARAFRKRVETINRESARAFRKRGCGEGRNTAVIGSAGPLKPVDRLLGEQLTRGKARPQETLALVFHSAGQSSPRPVSSRQANRRKL